MSMKIVQMMKKFRGGRKKTFSAFWKKRITVCCIIISSSWWPRNFFLALSKENELGMSHSFAVSLRSVWLFGFLVLKWEQSTLQEKLMCNYESFPVHFLLKSAGKISKLFISLNNSPSTTSNLVNENNGYKNKSTAKCWDSSYDPLAPINVAQSVISIIIF